MKYIRLTAIQMFQEHPVYVSIEKIVQVGEVTVVMPTNEEVAEGDEPKTEQKICTTLTLAGVPPIIVSESIETVMDLIKNA